MDYFITNGHVLDPVNQIDEVCDLRISNGKIAEIGKQLSVGKEEVIDASGCYVMPGLIDLHVHFRDPGFTQKEDIQTGSRAAAAGGFTTVVTMPNTKPVADKKEVIEYVTQKAEEVGLVKVLQVGAITKNMEGKELSQLDEMIEAGIVAISEDGKSVMNSQLYREAMNKAAKANITILAHCEDINLVNGGVIHQGSKARELNIPGISNAVENIIVARDIMLAEETGARLHLCHCSTKESVELLQQAKEKGISVSGEVCPHHFILTQDEIRKDDGNYKMNPPLRNKEDVEALKKALAEGIMEVISTDHAPHTKEEKQQGLQKAPFGIVGLETSAALTYTYLVKAGYLTPMEMVEKMSTNPARILGISGGSLSVGQDGDVTIFDPRMEYQIHGEEFQGKACNMPYENWKVTGRVLHTFCKGKHTYAIGSRRK